MSRSRIVRATVVAAAAFAAVAALLWSTDPNQIRNLVRGLGSGSLVAAIALGLVLTFRGSGVVNFASGATAMYVSYVYNDLRRHGRIFLPPLPNPMSIIEGIAHGLGFDHVRLPDVPTSIGLGGPFSLGLALALSAVVSVLLGAAFHWLIFRPMRSSPPLAKVVASVGLLLVMQAVVVLRFTAQPVSVKPIFRLSAPLRLPGGVVLPRDQVIVTVVVVGVTASLWAVFRWTRFGLATRAATESEKGAIVLGYSPDRLAAINWMLSSLLAGLLGILLASINSSTDPSTVTLLVVPALGAALVGGFTSFALTAAAAFGLECVKALITYWGTRSWFPHSGQVPMPGIREALPLVVIVAVLVLRGQSLPTRDALRSDRLPFAPTPNHLAIRTVVPTAIAAVGLLTLGSDWRLAITNTAIGAIVCLSLVVLTGYVGQVSLAQMALAGVAGFTLSRLAVVHGWPFPLGPLAGASAAALAGLLIGIPAVRVRGVNLAVVTIAASLAVENFVFKNPSLSGGIEGANVPPPRFFGLKFGPNDPASIVDGKLPNPWFGLFCLAVLVGLGVLVATIRRSPFGRRMLAVRCNEQAAAASGINVTGVKIGAFAFSAFVAGLGGTLSAYRFGSVTPENFGVLVSLSMLAAAYLGGISSVTGAMIGGFLISGGVSATVLLKWFHVQPHFTTLIAGLGLIITAVANPDGLAGAWRHAGSETARLVRKIRGGTGHRRPVRERPEAELVA